MTKDRQGLVTAVRYATAVVAMVLSSIILSLLALEIAIRIWDGVPVFSMANFVGLELDQIHQPGNAEAVYDPHVGWVQRANRSGGTLTAGEYGVRMPGPTIVPLQPNGILVVGDSFATGSEVPDQESWPAQLEQILGAQVINAGVGGYGFDQIALRAEMLVPLLKPRLLLLQSRLGFGIVADRMRIYGGAPKPYFTVDNGRLVLHNEPVPIRASKSGDIGWLRSVFGHSYLVQYVVTRLNLLHWWAASGLGNRYVLSNDESVSVSCLLMGRIARLREQYGVKVELVFQYSALDGMEDPLSWSKDREKILGCARERELPIVDGLDMLQSAYHAGSVAAYQKLWVMHDQKRAYGHMSKEGNAMIARLVAEQLPTIDNETR
jgi:hypothetical protein